MRERPRVDRKRTLVDRSLADIRNSSALYHVPHSEPLDSFVLLHATRAVGAAEVDNVATTLLVASAISSFCGLS